jgi:hypothetical protein
MAAFYAAFAGDLEHENRRQLGSTANSLFDFFVVAGLCIGLLFCLWVIVLLSRRWKL